jgi:hypothetical protein
LLFWDATLADPFLRMIIRPWRNQAANFKNPKAVAYKFGVQTQGWRRVLRFRNLHGVSVIRVLLTGVNAGKRFGGKD